MADGDRWSLASWKDGLVVAREAIIVVVLFSLLAWPGFVADRLEAAGFKRANVGGFEWEAALDEAAEETSEASERIEALERDLTRLRGNLGDLQGRIQDPGDRRAVAELNREVDETLRSTSTAGEQLKLSNEALERIKQMQLRPVRRVSP